MTAADQALALAPHSPDNLTVIGMHLALAGQWDQGLSLVQEAMGVVVRFSQIDFFPFQVNVAVLMVSFARGLELDRPLIRRRYLTVQDVDLSRQRKGWEKRIERAESPDLWRVNPAELLQMRC